MELKYKVWDKVKKEIIEVSTIDFREECITDKKYAVKKFTDIELLPPTGVKDINNKEYYLGDILKEKEPMYRKLSENEKTSFGIIKKEKNSNNMYLEWNYQSAYKGEKYWGTNELPITHVANYEIVGNIYENPDMIKKEIKG